MPYGFKKCDGRRCFRLTTPGSAFCCGNCSLADARNFEIHEHTDSCDARARQRRGELGWDPERIA
jgi:hypothetical protein